MARSRLQNIAFPAATGASILPLPRQYSRTCAREVTQYLSEIRRVLTPYGRAMLTVSRGLTESGRSTLNFSVNLHDCFTIDYRTPERAIAYSEAQLMALLQAAKLRLIAPVYYGSWSGRPSMLDAQDVVIVNKA